MSKPSRPVAYVLLDLYGKKVSPDDTEHDECGEGERHQIKRLADHGTGECFTPPTFAEIQVIRHPQAREADWKKDWPKLHGGHHKRTAADA